MESAPLDVLTGRLLDRRYHVRSRIAHGGMATVYLATDTRLDREVALKVMHADLARDAEFVDRFIGEAKSVARLSHQNVVQVYDQGADGQHLYLAMEYVPGRTLRALLRERGWLPWHEAMEILDPILAGLAAAHQAGIAHRDVKPENVLIMPDGRVKVVDFGLARASAAMSQTRSGVIIGSVAYIAPEQVTGAATDARTDVYAAGVMAFELMTGRQPYSGETPLAVAYAHVNSDVPPVSALVAGIPPAVDHLIRAATSRDPRQRPPSADVFLRAVRALRGVPEWSEPVSTAWAGSVAGTGSAGTGSAVAGAGPAPAGAGPAPAGAGPAGAAPAGIGPTGAAPTVVGPPITGPPGVGPGLAGPTLTGPGRAGSMGPEPAGTHTAVLGAAFGAARASEASTGGAAYAATGRYETVGAGVGAPPGGRYDALGGQPYGGAPPYGAPPYGAPPYGQPLYAGQPPYAGSPYGAPPPGGAVNGGAVNGGAVNGGAVNGGAVTGGHAGRTGRYDRQEPFLQRWLFSKRLAFLVVIVIVVLALGLGGWWLRAGRYANLPAVAGRPVAAARHALLQAGFRVRNEPSVTDNSVPKGDVISVSPSGRALSGATIAITVSRGPRLITVPPVAGKSLADATAALHAAGLTVSSVTKPVGVSGTVTMGAAAGTVPAAGTSWPQNKSVTINVVAGLSLPTLTGQDINSIQQWAGANHITLVQTPVASSSQPQGIIVAQSPKPGTPVPPGGTVSVSVSSGPPLVTIPDLKGQTFEQAQQTLQGLGFIVVGKRYFFGNKVYSTSPSGQAPSGSTVTVYYGGF